MKKITLTQGFEALVDDSEYERLNQYKWRYDTGYASRTVWDKEARKYHKIYMHRDVLPTEYPLVVDHIDRNKLNNTLGNLRAVTRAQNAVNAKKFKGNHTSRHRGVSFYKNLGKWVAKSTVSRKSVHLGVFDTEDAAKQAYDEFTQSRF